MADAARSLGLVVTVAGDAPQADGPAVLMLEAAARPEVCKLAALFALTEADVPAGGAAEPLPPVPVQDAWARLGRRVEPLKPAGTVEAAVRRIAALAAVDYDQYWSRRNVGNACDAVLPDMMPVGGTAHEMLDAVTGEAGLGYGIRHGRLVFTHGAGTGTRPDLSVLQPGPQVPAVLGGGYWLITTTDPVYPTISWQTYRRCRTCFSERSSRGQRR
jgi:hypothetical protein